eukprot:Skav221336  [mRNA]  locus=scaffold1234:146487:150953:+ [translate_table: standard]
MPRPKIVLDGRCLCIGSCCCLNITADAEKIEKTPLSLDKLSRSGSFASEETALDDRSTSSSFSRSYSAQWSDVRTALAVAHGGTAARPGGGLVGTPWG